MKATDDTNRTEMKLSCPNNRAQANKEKTKSMIIINFRNGTIIIPNATLYSLTRIPMPLKYKIHVLAFDASSRDSIVDFVQEIL